jgi:hypothetical protein
VNPASCHGRFFRRVNLGAFIWRVFMARKGSGFFEEKKKQKKGEENDTQ